MQLPTISALKSIYQDSEECVLLLAALSPTCIPCVEGAQLVQAIFEENKSEILAGAIVWTPMLQTESPDAAIQQELLFSDARLRQFWDPERLFGSLMSQTLNLRIPIAWNVYLLYLPGHPWDAEFPPSPEFWMHQQDEEPSLYLDPSHFKEYVQTVLERTAFND
jgi:hypothetical protein